MQPPPLPPPVHAPNYGASRHSVGVPAPYIPAWDQMPPPGVCGTAPQIAVDVSEPSAPPKLATHFNGILPKVGFPAEMFLDMQDNDEITNPNPGQPDDPPSSSSSEDEGKPSKGHKGPGGGAP